MHNQLEQHYVGLPGHLRSAPNQQNVGQAQPQQRRGPPLTRRYVSISTAERQPAPLTLSLTPLPVLLFLRAGFTPLHPLHLQQHRSSCRLTLRYAGLH